MLIGIVAGYLGGAVDEILMRLADVFLAFPRLILAIAFAAALGPGVENAILAIAIAHWPSYARLARAETLNVKNNDYIQAMRVLGAGKLRIMAGHIAAADAVLDHRADEPGHGHHHPHGGRARLPGPGRSAAHARVGPDGERRPPVPGGSVVGVHACPDWPSWWSSWASTCWGTGSGTCWTRASGKRNRLLKKAHLRRWSASALAAAYLAVRLARPPACRLASGPF